MSVNKAIRLSNMILSDLLISVDVAFELILELNIPSNRNPIAIRR